MVEAPTLARRLGVGTVWVKDECSRLGLPSFKILGASWATYRTLLERLGHDVGPWSDVAQLAEMLSPLRPLSLATATDGNHGRAVARMARLLGLGARIFVPPGTARTRMEAIEGEGAKVEVVAGSYDDAVRRAAEEASPECAVVADTAVDVQDRAPRLVIEGYSTIFRELDDQLPEPPDLVVVQMGVGALAAAVVHHYRRGEADLPLVGVEPDQAACVMASIRSGEIVSLPGEQHSIMAGLNCGTPSPVAWPAVSAGIDVFVAVPDDRAREAVRGMAEAGIVSGETGAAGLAGMFEALTGPEAEATRDLLGVDGATRVLIISTEGATDPEAYRRILDE